MPLTYVLGHPANSANYLVNFVVNFCRINCGVNFVVNYLDSFVVQDKLLEIVRLTSEPWGQTL